MSTLDSLRFLAIEAQITMMERLIAFFIFICIVIAFLVVLVIIDGIVDYIKKRSN